MAGGWEVLEEGCGREVTVIDFSTLFLPMVLPLSLILGSMISHFTIFCISVGSTEKPGLQAKFWALRRLVARPDWWLFSSLPTSSLCPMEDPSLSTLDHQKEAHLFLLCICCLREREEAHG